jgi:hypothetical protein
VKRTLLGMLAVALSAVACAPAPHHREQVKVYRLADGRRTYQDDSGVWLYWMLMPSGQYGFLPGAAPPVSAVADAPYSTATVIETSGANSLPQASTEVAPEGGGLSQASPGPTDSSPSVDTGAGGGSGESGGGASADSGGAD